MGKAGGFREFRRKDPGYRPRDVRVNDYRAVELRLSDEDILDQAARCMDCGTPFCHGCGCPLGNVVPELNDLVYHRRWSEALEILLSTNNFPEFTGRVCPALCEGSCVLGIHDEPVTIRQIELAIIEKAFQDGYIRPRAPERRHEGAVAVIGSGPAGLAVADMLNQAGYRVCVYDCTQKPGGILRYGIPDFKLEKWVVDRRIQLMKDEGIAFEMGVDIGSDISYRYLTSRYAAICLAGGAREPRDLKVPGRELGGIHFAMDFLVQQNRRIAGEDLGGEPAITAEGKAVVVIGGGDTGSDCVGTAWRQKARQVTQLEILPKPPPTRSEATPWPLWPHVLRQSSSHLEGGERRWSVMTKAFVGESGAVRRVRGAEVEWGPAEAGRSPLMREKAGTDFELDAELVLLAMGFSGIRKTRLIEEMGIEMDARGHIRKDAGNMTTVPGIFVAGDMAQGASLVVRAIADGRRTARAMIQYLESMRDAPPIKRA